MARRMNARRAVPAFPFYCASSLGGNPAGGPTEIEGSQKGISSGEVWCPVWSQPATLRDLTSLFSQGRMQVSGRDARLATQFVRALGRHGCDRGVAAFQRYGLLRRSGSFGKQDQTSTLAVPLGLYTVSPSSDLELLDEFLDYEDDVLSASGRRAVVNSDSQPRRIISARRRLEEALFEASRAGLESHKTGKTKQTTDLCLKLMDVAVAGATLERECGLTDGRIHDREGKMPDKKDGPNVPCAPSLSYDWLRLKHVAPLVPPKLVDLPGDGTAEWRLARAIGTICPWGKKPERSKRTEPSAVGPVRENLIRVVRSERRAFWNSESESRRAVWSWKRDALSNCASVLQRRLIDAQAGSGNGLPLFSPYGADANDLLALWHGGVDDTRLGELLHAFALVRPWRNVKAATPEIAAAVVGDAESEADGDSGDLAFEERNDERADTTGAWLARLDAAAQLPRAYALLKLCFVGGRLPPRPGQARTGKEPYAPGNLHIMNLLVAGRGDEACAAAARRLHAVGYPPLFATSQSFSPGFVLSTADSRRLAGLLLVPIRFAADLARLIIKPTQEDHDEYAEAIDIATD
jgi:CRISPR-associated protein Csx17